MDSEDLKLELNPHAKALLQLAEKSKQLNELQLKLQQEKLALKKDLLEQSMIFESLFIDEDLQSLTEFEIIPVIDEAEIE